MVQRFYLTLGLLIGAGFPFLVESTVILPAVGEVGLRSPSNVDSSTPLCYIQIEGSGMIDVTSICGKNISSPTAGINSSTTSTPPTIRPAAPPPPNFTPAATAGKCNFLDANGKPCPKTDADKPDATKPDFRISL